MIAGPLSALHACQCCIHYCSPFSWNVLRASDDHPACHAIYKYASLVTCEVRNACEGSTWHNNMGCWPKRSWCEEMSIDNVGAEYLGHRANGVVSMLNVMRPAISCCNLRFGGQCCSDSCSSRQADAPVVQLSEMLPQLATASMISRCSKANPQQAGTKMHTCCAFSMPARSNILTCTSSKGISFVDATCVGFDEKARQIDIRLI